MRQHCTKGAVQLTQTGNRTSSLNNRSCSASVTFQALTVLCVPSTYADGFSYLLVALSKSATMLSFCDLGSEALPSMIFSFVKTFLAVAAA